MLFNLRAKCTNNNGASSTYTWRAVELATETEAHDAARAWGQHEDERHKMPNPTWPYATLAMTPGGRL